MSTNDVALVCGDGAIKGGFIAGAVTALIDRFPKMMSELSVITATSASVGSMFYYLSHGEQHPGHHIWKEALASSNFIDFNGIVSFYSEKPLYDIEYMADVVFKKEHPLNIENVLNSRTKFIVPVQNYLTKELEYFSNREYHEFERDGRSIPVHPMRDVDIYELIKAATSAPFVYDRPILLNGTPYMDAATLEPFILDHPDLVGKRKIVIISKNDRRIKKSLSYKLTGYAWPFLVAPFKKHKFDSEIYAQYANKPEVMQRLAAALKILEKYEKTIIVSPDFQLGAITDNTLPTLKKNFEHGVELIERLIPDIESKMGVEARTLVSELATSVE